MCIITLKSQFILWDVFPTEEIKLEENSYSGQSHTVIKWKSQVSNTDFWSYDS